jgi:dimeric dUTPase (all-alpha-NTP-PPase superfamily)
MEKDMLEKMFEKQKELQEKLNATYDQPYINTMTLATIDELMELLRETPWKPWKINQSFNHENYKKEMADIWHFIINLCLADGISAEDIYEEYMNKNKINFKRNEDKY